MQTLRIRDTIIGLYRYIRLALIRIRREERKRARRWEGLSVDVISGTVSSDTVRFLASYRGKRQLESLSRIPLWKPIAD